jgi:hypothetical protein
VPVEARISVVTDSEVSPEKAVRKKYATAKQFKDIKIRNQINDGAFDAMMEAIQTDRTPNFYFM